MAISPATHARSAWVHQEVDPLAEAMIANCYVSWVYAFNLKTSGGINADQQARNWMIPIAKARRTIKMTTQRGIHMRPDALIQQFKTNDRMLRYNRINATMYTDMLKAQSRSHHQNLYSQVFAIPPAWIQAYAIKQKSDSHEALSDLLRDVGAP
jgi:hypothetical protein